MHAKACDFERARCIAGLVVSCIVASALLVAGCRESGDQASEADQPEARPARVSSRYPDPLSADSSPEDVARRLIQALDEEDGAALLGLVAVEAEMAAVDRIHKRHGRESKISPDGVCRMTAAGWQATYAFLRRGETRVDRSEVHGDAATVFAVGTKPTGAVTTLRINLTREGGVWKVRAGLKEGTAAAR